MKIAVRHNLQIYAPGLEDLREQDAVVLPIQDAEAVMGETVAAYLARVAWRFDLPTVCRINGEYYSRAEWETRALGVNDNIEFVSRPLGGGSSSGSSSSKSIIGVVALVALTVLAPYAVAAAGAALGTAALGATAATLTFAGKLAAAVIIGAGALAISHFLKPKSGGKTDSSDSLYSFGFQGNAARPMQTIPVLNGRTKFAPDYAAPTYSEFSGDEMTDYALFSLTCGRMDVEQLLIGDTPIWDKTNGFSPDYPGIEIQIVEPGEEVTLYPVNVVTAEELQGVELQTTFTPGYIVNAAGTKATELIFDFVWPGGAYATYKDRTLPATTHVQIDVRTVNDAGAPTGDWITILSDPYVQAKQSQIRMTVRRLVEPGRYEVRGKRVNASINDSGIAKVNGTDDVNWTALRAKIQGPQSFPRVTTLAVKGTASKQLSGISGGQLKVIGTRILPVWKDGRFVEEPTRSIAWAALDWWRNGDYSAGLSLSDVDFQAFVRYDALWTQLGHTFDFRFTEVQNLDDVLETVLKAGRAFPSPVGDKITITRDEPRGLPRMLFTDNDIVAGSLEIDYGLSDEAWADGMVGQYLDQTTWRLAEVSSAPEGVELLKPALVQLEGIVDRKQATGAIRFMAAESQYRRITVTWTAFMEGRLLKKGDLVRISTEEPETWGQSREIVSLNPVLNKLVVDPAPQWEEGQNHYIEVRSKDGSPWGPVRVAKGSNEAEIIVAVSEFNGVTLAEAAGRSETQEPSWLVFSPGQPRSFGVLIMEGDPDQNGEHIHLTGAMDAPEVYTTTENGVPPLIQIPDLYSTTLPVIDRMYGAINQRQLTLILSAGWQPAQNAVTYQADVSYDGGVTWMQAYTGDRTTFEAVVGGSDNMRVRARGVTINGDPGPWSVITVEAPLLELSNDRAGITRIDYEGLALGVRQNLDHVYEVETYAIGVATQARADFLAADGKAQDALNRALESLGNDSANAAAILREENTRIEQNSALAYSLEVVVAKSNDNAAAIIREQTARTDADGAFATSLESVRAQTASNSAAITLEQTARADGDSANATSISGLRADVNTHVTNLSGFIVDERTVRADADGALGRRIDLVAATSDGYGALILSEQKARADGDSAQATRTDLLIAQTNSDRTFLQNLSGQADADRIFIQNLKSQTDADRAYFLNEQTARIDNDNAFAQQISALVAQYNGNVSAISRIDQAISDNYSAQARTNTELYARSDAGTAFGRFSIRAASSVPGGVTARLEALLAAQRDGQTYGAGMVFDLFNDGTSQIRFDADRFIVTSGGTDVPVFSIINGVLRSPTIRIDSGNFLPNSITQSNTGYTDSESVAQFGITTRPGEAVLILAESKGAPLTPLPPGQEGVLRISRDGTPLRDKAANLYALRGADGNISFQSIANTSSYRDYPPPGYHVYQVINTNNQSGVGYTYFGFMGS